MEAIIEKYNDWKKIEGFINCLKKSINWICLVNDDYNETCAMHRFLFKLEQCLSKCKWEEKIDEFVLFAKTNDDFFMIFSN